MFSIIFLNFNKNKLTLIFIQKLNFNKKQNLSNQIKNNNKILSTNRKFKITNYYY